MALVILIFSSRLKTHKEDCYPFQSILCWSYSRTGDQNWLKARSSRRRKVVERCQGQDQHRSGNRHPPSAIPEPDRRWPYGGLCHPLEHILGYAAQATAEHGSVRAEGRRQLNLVVARPLEGGPERAGGDGDQDGFFVCGLIVKSKTLSDFGNAQANNGISSSYRNPDVC